MGGSRGDKSREEPAVWLGPQRRLEVACAWAESSRLGPGAGWAAVVLLNSWPELAGGNGGLVRAKSG